MTKENHFNVVVCVSFESCQLLFISRTQYKWTGHLHTGKCIYWKYVVEAELSKLTYVED